MRFLPLLVGLVCAAGCGPAPPPAATGGTTTGAPPLASPAFDQTFWNTWSDGQAELAAYDLSIPRYGQLRRGVAVAIFVTETFSNSLRVKADPGKHAPADEFPVMKLNLVKDYQTGVYDYNEMTSTFVALRGVNGRGAGTATKISFSRQEWCGNTYQQLLFDAGTIRATRHSYFDGDADSQASVSYPADGVSEDALYLWARGMASPALEPGASRAVSVLPSAAYAKGAGAAWQPAVLSRSAQPRRISVPGGSFSVEVLSARIGAGDQRVFYVEAAPPHRLIQWESSSGERAVFVKSVRMKYWERNGLGQEDALKQLGLSPRPPRTT
ncbi:MAG TPA: hypothetical protein VFA33_23705 [Bryobacteraceae bacterium]|nr:hypothetical protein [Bryobacteraceae bacterium]